MLVLAGNLLNLGLLDVLSWGNHIDVAWCGKTLTGGKQTVAVVCKLYAYKV